MLHWGHCNRSEKSLGIGKGCECSDKEEETVLKTLTCACAVELLQKCWTVFEIMRNTDDKIIYELMMFYDKN